MNPRGVRRAAWVRVPNLYYSHPNFFFIYAATLLFHLALFGIGVFGRPPNFASPSLQVVNSFAGPMWWGVASVVICAAMVAGLYRSTFGLARLALATGACLCLLRAFLIAIPLITGETRLGLTALPVWALAAALHLSLTAEPSRNPETATVANAAR